MTDTIEWLETIGKTARLRHASTEELVQILEQADASIALKAAVKGGDGALLSAEYGYKIMRAVDDVHTPAREEEEDPDSNEVAFGLSAASAH